MSTEEIIKDLTPCATFGAYQRKVRKAIVRAGFTPVKAERDEAGNCIVCWECGRCPGWHTSAEYAAALSGSDLLSGVDCCLQK